MRKLLAILGSLSLVATTSSIVVACKKDNDDDNTGWHFINADGSLNITSEGLLKWYQDNIGIENAIAQVKEFYQLFAVAILQNSADENSAFSGLAPSQTADQYVLEDFQNKLKELWGSPDDFSSVQGAANNSWKKKEESAKKNWGDKNWKKNLIEELSKKFPYVNKDFDSLKAAYINNDILTNTETGAEAQLTKLLAKTYSKDTYNTPLSRESLLSTFYNNWQNIRISQLAAEINNQLTSDPQRKQAKTQNILDLFNATGGANIIASPSINPTAQPWKLSSIVWVTKDTTITSAMITDLLYRLSTNYDSSNQDTMKSGDWQGSRTVSLKWLYVNAKGDPLNNINTYFDLIDSYPNFDFANLQLTGNQTYGMVTNSQRFLVDQFLQNQKPVAISEVIFKKGDNADLTKLINGQSFLTSKESNPKNWERYYGLFNFLQNYVMENGGSNDGISDPIPGIGQYTFDTIFGNMSKDRIGKIRLDGTPITEGTYWWDNSFYETKNEDKLLTLNNTDYSKTLKYSVYDFLQASDHTAYQLNTTGQPASANEISQDLQTNWAFTDSTITDAIQAAITKADSASQPELMNGLYGTLNLIKALNRTTDGTTEASSEDQVNNNMYQVLNAKQGILAFIDSDGLHITKINGFDALQKQREDQKTSLFGTTDAEKTKYLNEVKSFNRLNTYAQQDTSGNYRYIYQDYNSIIGTSGFDQSAFYAKVGLPNPERLTMYGTNYQDLNTSVSNEYEKFLLNNSILTANTGSNATNNPPFYKFDLFKEVNDSISNNASNENALSTNNSWLWDYCGTILNMDNTQLLEEFFQFDANDESSQTWRQWLIKRLDLSQKHTMQEGNSIFRQGWSDWNREIEKSRSTNSLENKVAPLIKLSWGDNQSHINNVISLENFQPFFQTLQNGPITLNFERIALEVTGQNVAATANIGTNNRRTSKGEK